MNKKLNVFIGIVIVLFSAFMYLLTGDMPKESALFPRGLIILFAILGILLSITSLKDKKDSSKDIKTIFASTKEALIGLGIITAYAVAINFVGFFIATTVFIVAFMIVYKQKSIRKIMITAVVLNLFIYLVFVYQLNVPLPKGFLFN